MKSMSESKSKKLKVSVAMATYNGDRFLEEQLRSILDQTRQPDEVIICDDCSTDRSIEIIKGFISQNDLRNWKLFTNEYNLGLKRNFLSALERTSGEILFFSDQDDIWTSDKIEVMSRVLEENERILALHSYGVSIDESGSKIDPVRRFSNSKETKKIVPLNFTWKTIMDCATGCKMCFRRSVYEYMYPLICTKGNHRCLTHDFIFWMAAGVFDGRFLIDCTLIKQRVHMNNQTASRTALKYESKKAHLRKIVVDRIICEKLINFFVMDDRVSKCKIDALKISLNSAKARVGFFRQGNFFPYFRYNSFINASRRVTVDFIYLIGRDKIIFRICSNVLSLYYRKIKFRYHI